VNIQVHTSIKASARTNVFQPACSIVQDVLQVTPGHKRKMCIKTNVTLTLSSDVISSTVIVIMLFNVKFVLP